MEVCIVKEGEDFFARAVGYSGVMGVSKTQNGAISSLIDNFYDYCNWLFTPLPKDMTVKTAKGERVGDTLVLENEKELNAKTYKKYCEVAFQAAFSYKSFVGGFELSDEETAIDKELMKGINALCPEGEGQEGILAVVSQICGDEPVKMEGLAKIRIFAEKILTSARQIYFSAKKRGEHFTDSFRFGAKDGDFK